MIGKFYAIRFRDYVEFRVAIKPPKRKVSKLIKPIKKENLIYENLFEPPYFRVRKETIDTTFTMKQVSYIGGKVLGYCKLSAYVIKKTKLGLSPIKYDGMVEIKPEAMKILMKDGVL